MMEHMLTTEVFRAGLKEYLNERYVENRRFLLLLTMLFQNLSLSLSLFVCASKLFYFIENTMMP